MRAGGGKPAALSDKKPVGGDTESCMMMKAAPVAAFEVSQAELLFKFFIIAFDDPALFGQRDQIARRDIFPQVGQLVFARLGFAAWPLD